MDGQTAANTESGHLLDGHRTMCITGLTVDHK